MKKDILEMKRLIDSGLREQGFTIPVTSIDKESIELQNQKRMIKNDFIYLKTVVTGDNLFEIFNKMYGLVDDSFMSKKEQIINALKNTTPNAFNVLIDSLYV